MKSAESAPAHPVSEFSLSEGGPLYTYVLSRLTPFWRFLFPALLGWMPLLILSAWGGAAFDRRLTMPFVLDLPNHVRFLIALPLLFLAEEPIEKKVRLVIAHFTGANVVDAQDRLRFQSVLRSATELRDWRAAEALLLALAYFSSAFLSQFTPPPGVTTWRTLGVANFWFRYASIPFLQFVFLRFLWRFAIWVRLLAQTARLRLNVIPSHPDQLGGLGFIRLAHASFSVSVLALSCVLSAAISQMTFRYGIPAQSYYGPLGVYVGLSLAVMLAPLLVFTPRLYLARQHGLLDYSKLGERYTQAFERKWIHRTAPQTEQLLGTQDLQALSDLQNSFGTVHRLRLTLINRDLVLLVILCAVLPMFPLLLEKVPLKTMIELLFKLAV